MPARSLHDLGLPDVVVAFGQQPSGLIFFAGGPGSGKTTSANALAEHVAAVTGREVASFETADAEERPGSMVFLADGGLNVDRLAAMVDAAVGGALVIATLESGPHPYSRLVDLVQAAEDWSGELRRNLDAVLYAVVYQTLPSRDGAPEVELRNRHQR